MLEESIQADVPLATCKDVVETSRDVFGLWVLYSSLVDVMILLWGGGLAIAAEWL